MKRIQGKGFTLMEMLVVIAIIGILAALIATAVTRVSDSGARQQAEMDISLIYKAAAEYKFKFGDYPPFTDGNLEYDASSTTNALYLLTKTNLLSLDMSRLSGSGTSKPYLDPWRKSAYQVKVISKTSSAPLTGMAGIGPNNSDKIIYIYSVTDGDSGATASTQEEKIVYLKGGK